MQIKTCVNMHKILTNMHKYAVALSMSPVHLYAFIRKKYAKYARYVSMQVMQNMQKYAL